MNKVFCSFPAALIAGKMFSLPAVTSGGQKALTATACGAAGRFFLVFPARQGNAPAQRSAGRSARAAIVLLLHFASQHRTYFAPQAFEIDSAARLTGEVFGPILHVVRWHADRLDAVLDEIAATGYGLTLGIHSRIDETVRHILARLRVGNSYVNRSMIGAVVGVQPFGGEALSGTGSKAGGPRYLYRFATERTVSTDTTAAGGNATLLSLQEEN